MGGPEVAPHTPPTFGAPRRSRGARLNTWGAPNGPPYPPTFGAPRRSRGAPLWSLAGERLAEGRGGVGDGAIAALDQPAHRHEAVNHPAVADRVDANARLA